MILYLSNKTFNDIIKQHFLNSYLLLWPTKIFTNKFVELLIVFSKIFSQFGHYFRIHPGMSPTFGFSQTTVGRFVPQTVKTLGFVKVKVVGSDAWFQTQELFDFLDLWHWIFDQKVTIDDEKLLSWKCLKPSENGIMKLSKVFSNNELSWMNKKQ